MVAANRAVASLLDGISDLTLLAPPVNVLRLSLHPGGLAPRIANLSAWRAHILERLRHQISASRDPVLSRLLAELTAFATAPDRKTVSKSNRADGDLAGAVVPLELETTAGRLSLISTTMVFGTAMDVTLSELAIEAFFPANPQTIRLLHELAAPAALNQAALA